MLPNQMFNAVLSSLRTFDPLSDTLDILIISFVFYQLLQFARKSRAGQLVKGIILILVFYGLAVMLNLKTVTWVLNNVITIGFMAAVVIFQPELRRTLERMGQSTMWANLLVGNRRSDPSLRGAWQSAVVAICDAAEQLSDTRTGALMVLERNNNLDEIIRTGTPMHADVIPEMLGTIFYEGTVAGNPLGQGDKRNKAVMEQSPRRLAQESLCMDWHSLYARILCPVYRQLGTMARVPGRKQTAENGCRQTPCDHGHAQRVVP